MKKFLSWFFEITPEGLQLESHVEPDESIATDTGRRLNFMIAFGILLVVAGMAVQYFVFSKWVVPNQLMRIRSLFCRSWT